MIKVAYRCRILSQIFHFWIWKGASWRWFGFWSTGPLAGSSMSLPVFFTLVNGMTTAYWPWWYYLALCVLNWFMWSWKPLRAIYHMRFLRRRARLIHVCFIRQRTCCKVSRYTFTVLCLLYKKCNTVFAKFHLQCNLFTVYLYVDILKLGF